MSRKPARIRAPRRSGTHLPITTPQPATPQPAALQTTESQTAESQTTESQVTESQVTESPITQPENMKLRTPDSQTSLPRLLTALNQSWAWLRQQRTLQRLHPRSRRLQVHETVQLGEKRFVSILRVDGEQFLIGGSPTGISLLAALEPDHPTVLRAEPGGIRGPAQPSSFASVFDTATRHSASRGTAERQACA